MLEQDETLVCVVDHEGVLVWMLEKKAKALLAKRAAVERLADEKASAEYAAKVRAEAEKAAAEKAAEDAAAEDAARVAAEQAVQQPAPEPAPVVPAPAAAYYPNCAAARAAGASPLFVGQPGYRGGLDRDKDGVACELSVRAWVCRHSKPREGAKKIRPAASAAGRIRTNNLPNEGAARVGEVVHGNLRTWGHPAAVFEEPGLGHRQRHYGVRRCVAELEQCRGA